MEDGIAVGGVFGGSWAFWQGIFVNIQLDCFEGGFLRHDLLNVWLKAGVCLQQLLAETALHGGLDLGAIARWDTVGEATLAYLSSIRFKWLAKGVAHSFLNMVLVVGGQWKLRICEVGCAGRSRGDFYICGHRVELSAKCSQPNLEGRILILHVLEYTGKRYAGHRIIYRATCT